MANISSSTNSQLSKLQDVATQLGLPLAETDGLVNVIARDMLRSVFRYPGTKMEGNREVAVPLTAEELDVNQRCEALYKRWYGQDFPPFRRKIRATALFGPPGHGKTTVFEVAARRVADGLGMRFLSPEKLESVELEDVNLNTFVFVSQETAGVVSALEWMGLPSAEQIKGTTEKYMGRLFTLPLRKLMQAGGGVLLLDDYLNAARQIQDVGLSLTDRRRVGQLNLAQTYFGVTGNLGSLDDTNATRASAALRNRMRMYMAHDTPANFIARIQADPAYRDELGDGFVRMFLHRYEEKFSEYPERGKQGAYTTPRSLKDFIDEVRDCLHAHGGRKNAARARAEIKQIAQATLGLETALSFDSFLEAVLTKADPLARQIIVEGKMSIEEIRGSYSEGGFSMRETTFGAQFAMALVDYTVQKVIADDSLDVAIERFAKGVSILSETDFAFALDELKSKMTAQVTDVNKHKLVVSASADRNSKRRILSGEASEKMGNLIMQHGTIDASRRAVMIGVFSEMSMHESRPASSGGRTRARTNR